MYYVNVLYFVVIVVVFYCDCLSVKVCRTKRYIEKATTLIINGSGVNSSDGTIEKLHSSPTQKGIWTVVSK